MTTLLLQSSHFCFVLFIYPADQTVRGTRMIGKKRLSNLPDASRVHNLRLVQCHSVDWRLIAAIF